VLSYSLPQIRIFAREAARAQRMSILAQAAAIGIAFGGEQAASELLRDED
jgi:hypothetical protein